MRQALDPGQQKRAPMTSDVEESPWLKVRGHILTVLDKRAPGQPFDEVTAHEVRRELALLVGALEQCEEYDSSPAPRPEFDDLLCDFLSCDVGATQFGAEKAARLRAALRRDRHALQKFFDFLVLDALIDGASER